MKNLIIVGAIVLTALTFTSTASASDGCYTGDYQGAPIEICPEQEPDPTNCYTGEYQGAPIEVCMPTGSTLPEGSTFNGQPVVIQNSVNYVPPVVESPLAAEEQVAVVALSPQRVTIGTFFNK